jgi:hypothetical protein
VRDVGRSSSAGPWRFPKAVPQLVKRVLVAPVEIVAAGRAAERHDHPSELLKARARDTSARTCTGCALVMVTVFTARPAGDRQPLASKAGAVPASRRFPLPPAVTATRPSPRPRSLALAVARCDALAPTRMTRFHRALELVTEHATSVRSGGYSPLTWRQHSCSTPTMKSRAVGHDTQTVDLRGPRRWRYRDERACPPLALAAAKEQAAVVLRGVVAFAFVLDAGGVSFARCACNARWARGARSGRTR